MKKASIIIPLIAVILAAAGCAAADTPVTEIIGGADGPTSIYLTQEAGEDVDEEETDDLITEEQTLSAIKEYCHVNNPDLMDIEKEGEYPVYWEIEPTEENEIVVLFRSYTGALIRYHIEPVSGDTYVTEYVPGITPEEQRTDEQFNIRDYSGGASLSSLPETADSADALYGQDPNVNTDRLRNLYPEFFDNDRPPAKGIEVYVWQMAENSYSCGLMFGTNRDKTAEEIWDLQNMSVSIDEAKAILNECGVSGEEVIVIPIHQPYSSYMYEIDDDYCEHVTQLFR